MGFGVGAAEINIVSKRFVLSRGFWRKLRFRHWGRPAAAFARQ